MKKLKFAVIIAVHNAAPWLERALDSLQNQTHNNWQAICIDDASTDESLQILEKFASSDKRFYLLRHSINKGPGAARNTALRELENIDFDWITFLDADDMLAPKRLENVAIAMSEANESEIDYICSHFTLIDNTKQEIPKNIVTHPIDNKLFKIVTTNGYFANGDIGGTTFDCWISHRQFKTHKIMFPEDMHVLEDQVFSIRNAIRARKIMLHYATDYYYFCHRPAWKKLLQPTNSTMTDILRCMDYINAELPEIKSAEIKYYFRNKWKPQKAGMLLKATLTRILRTIAAPLIALKIQIFR